MKVKDDDEIRKIFKETEYESSVAIRDNEFEGLKILSKYSNNVVCSAEHDQIWSIYLDNAVKGGITVEECVKLRKMGWFEDCDSFSTFV